VAKAYQQGLRDQGTPAAMFYVSDARSRGPGYFKGE
jgi:hypothetical protein